MEKEELVNVEFKIEISKYKKDKVYTIKKIIAEKYWGAGYLKYMSPIKTKDL